ncbi:MAG: ParB N-terminal domain-containing protein [Treponema sp.]|nr:ParB N-terminal domain-containing protein [Treponema sp.]
MIKLFQGKKQIDPQNTNPSYIMMDISEIKTHEKLSSIFAIKPEILDKIIASMKEGGYDTSQPLVIGRIKDIGDYLVDGHTRREAAIKAGLKNVPVKIIEFENFEESQYYTYKRQSERRNLSQIEILHAASLLPERKTRDGTGRSGKLLADELGVSESTITKAKFVKNNATEQDIQDIKNDKETINSITNKIKSKKNNETNEHLSESNTPIHRLKKENVENIPESNNTTTDENHIAPIIDEQSTTQPTLVDLVEIIRVLNENNEKKAILVIMSNFKNDVTERFFSYLKKET